MSGDAHELSNHLSETLKAFLGEISVTDLTRLSGGANRETWSLNATDDQNQSHPLILQLDRPGMERLEGTCAREAKILSVAKTKGVPVPSVIASGETPNLFGRSFSITSRINGETIARKILRDSQWKVARENFVADSAKALAAIHSIKKTDFDGVQIEETPDPLGTLESVYDALADPHPTFDLAFRWLAKNKPAATDFCFVHGDFRLGNLLLGETGLSAVLDWEISHFGDPCEDLGWMCVRAWRFGGSGEVAGIADYENLLEQYHEASGRKITLPTLLWWEIFGTLRWGVICLQMGGDFRTGRTNSLEIAAIGRRVAENEYDLLTSLGRQVL
ncbi:MAG: phosphotransferase family protein [Actinomycetota bacterium]|nr:phosphotransferase family protein [Actinomycetota bacterium]